MNELYNQCPHRSVRIVWTRYSNYGQQFDRRHLRQQCEDCGRLFGSSLKSSIAMPDTPEITQEEAMREHRALERRRAQYSQECAEKEAQARAQWRANHAAYMQTDRWAELRRLVFARAKFVCEGCREATAEQVHHLTYAHFGDEFLWELVAVCRDCHERYHDINE